MKIVLKIAIVEDENASAELLEQNIRQYSAEFQIPVEIHLFTNASAFLDQYSAQYGMIFMDIMMPMLNGMDAAHALREKDSAVLLIFVTSMQQYAIQGYEVGATDFIVKPVKYPQFKLKFTRFLSKIQFSPSRKSTDVLLKTESGYVRLLPRQISYVEVRAHHCIYHTDLGEFRIYQTMKSVAQQLEPCGFAKCNNYLLVNLTRITKISGMEVVVGKETLPISHPRKNEFIARFVEFTESKKK